MCFNRTGFTLIELSIGLTILSLLAAGALTVGGVMVEQQQFTGSNERVAEAKQALLDYFSVNNRLPCPARRTEAPGTTNFGVAVDCTVAGAAPAGTLRRSATAAFSGAANTPGIVRVGVLPVRTLGLRDSAMADEYGNRILYAMTETFASDNIGDITNALGAITLLDAKDNVIAAPSANNGAVFVVFSTGPDGKGGYRYSTGSSPVSCSGGLDAENCDANITFRDTRFNNGKVAAEYFDDMLAWSPKYLLTSLSATKAAGSTGQVQYNNGGFLGANPSFFWDITNARLGIGTSTPTQTLHIAGNASGSANQTGAQIGSVGTGTGPLFLVHNSPNVAGNAYFNTQWRYGGGTGKPATIGLSDGIRFYVSNAAVGAANAAIPDFSVAAMTISPTGTVGIGTSPSTDGLSVINNATNIYAGRFYNMGTHGLVGSGTRYGLVGYARENIPPDKYGVAVHGINYGTNAQGNLGYGSTGVFGYTPTAASNASGVHGQSDHMQGAGVLGTNQATGSHGWIANGPHGIVGYGVSISSGAGYGVYAASAHNAAFCGLARADGYSMVCDGGRQWIRSFVEVFGQPGIHGKTSMRIYAPGGNLREDWPGTWAGGLAVWDITGESAYFSYYNTRSDRRYKKDITPLDSEHMVDAVMKLRPVSYHYKDKQAVPNLQYGFIAQDVREVMPNLITGRESKTEKLGMNYDGLLAPLVTTVQALKRELDDLRTHHTTPAATAAPLPGPSPAITWLIIANAVQSLLWLIVAVRWYNRRKVLA